MTEDRILEIWTIYDNPLDYPGFYVVRVFHINSTTRGGAVPEPEPRAVARSLDEARDAIPEGLAMLPATPGEHPSIVESWL